MGAFVRSRHAAAVDLNPALPLCEAYDYGFHHPCVVWYQWAPWGHLRVLGGVMGSDLHLDAFLPIVERYRDLWFPTRTALEATCDPAGAANNSQGLRGTPVGMIRDWYREHGERDAEGEYTTVRYSPNANAPERRVAATQRAATYMRRLVQGEEAFLVDPERWILAELKDERFDSFFVDALEAGYVLEDEARHSERLGTLHVPKKDGWFEHPMNCFEYGLQAHVLDLPLGNVHAEEAKVRHRAQVEREAQRELKKQQEDRSEPDERAARSGQRGRFARRRCARLLGG